MSNIKENKINSMYFSALQLAVILLLLYFSSFYNYLLFHSLAEIFCIVIAFGIFVVTWNSRKFIDNNYFILIGVAYFFIGLIDLLHTLAFKDMGVFYGDTANLATQLWLATRYLGSLSFLIAPFFIARKLKSTVVFYSYLAVAVIILLSIFYWKNFPVAYVASTGLTQFKILSEYFISAILIVSIFILYNFKDKFDKRVFNLLVASLFSSTIAGVFFTKYLNVFGLANLTGHMFAVTSFYLFYLGILETGLMKPYRLLFKNLKDQEVALRKSEEKYRSFVELSPQTIIVHQNRIITYINPAGVNLLGAKETKEILGKDVLDFFHQESREKVSNRIKELNNNALLTMVELKMLKINGQIIEVEANGKKIEDQAGVSILVMLNDITLRKKTEQELQEKQLFVEQLINATPNILYIYDLFERRFVFVNSEFTKQLGHTAEKLMQPGHYILQELVHPDDFEKVVEHHRQLYSAKQGEIFKIEYRMKDTDGKWHWLEKYDTVFMKTDTGVTKQIIGTAQDFTQEKQASLELFEIKETLQHALDSNPDPFVIYNAKRQYTFVNERASIVFGLSKNEIIGRTDEELFSKETHEQYLTLLNKTIDTRTKQSQECDIKFPSGEVTYFVTFVPLFNKSGVLKQVIGSNYDITKSKKAATALKDSEERYRSIVELSPDALIIHYFGKIVFINTAGLYLFGFKNKKEIIGKNLLDFFHPDFKDFVASRINQPKIGTEDPPLLDSRIVTADGRSIDVEIKGTAINYQGKPAAQTIIRDVTTRKLAIDDASDHVVITDPRGVIIYANKAAERMTGYGRSEMIGQTSSLWGNCVGKDLYQNITACTRAWDTVKKNGNSSFVGEVVNQRKNGERYIADLHLSPVYEQGKIIFYISIERDITRLKEIDRAKTEFVSLASHQLRTPLTGISLSSELLLRGVVGPIDPLLKPYIEEIYDSSQKMKNLIDDFLNISRIELGTFVIKPEALSLPAEIDQVVESLALQIENKQLALSKRYDDSLPNIDFDRNILTIIIENLLTNAIRYTAAKGEIGLEIINNVGEVLIKVSDTGCGIPQSQQAKVFNKLFRAENAKEISADGAGLGLYMVKSLIKRVGSKIWLESELGVGTTFFVSIPKK